MATTVRVNHYVEPSRSLYFFKGGGEAGCIYNEDQAARVKFAYDNGHQIASHSWSHPDLNTLNWDQRTSGPSLAAESLTHLLPIQSTTSSGSWKVRSDLFLFSN